MKNNIFNPPTRLSDETEVLKFQRELKTTEAFSGRPRYSINKKNHTIIVFHADLDKSWWKRGESSDETKVKEIEKTICLVTGLKRVTRHHERFAVIFKLAPRHFTQAAVAVRLKYGEQDYWLSRIE